VWELQKLCGSCFYQDIYSANSERLNSFRKKQWPNWLTASERESLGFAMSQVKRKLIETLFGWIKSVAGLRKTKFRGRRRAGKL